MTIYTYIKSFFWSTFEVTFTNSKNTQKNIKHYRGFTWEVVNFAVEETEELTKINNEPWAISNIRRI